MSASRPSWSYASILALAAALAVSACGDIVVAAAPVDAKADQGTAVVDTAQPADTAVPVVDAVPETAGIACETEFDCGGLIGKTPCKLPTCDNKICKWKLRVAGEACEDFSDPPGQCEVAQCDAAGQCLKKQKANGVACGAFACGKKCAVGLCVAASTTDYDDKNPCTDDFCDQGKEVVHVPVPNFTGTCNDGDACTTGDVCITGKCQGQLKACNDNIACTLDTCDKAKDCIYTPNPAKCDDGDPCTKDGCDLAEGCTVVGEEIAKPCDDTNPCTKSDVCKQGKGCAGIVDAALCACDSDAKCADKSTPCGGKFVCALDGATGKGICQLAAGSAVECDTEDDTACSKNKCDPKTGQCAQQAFAAGKECDDGDVCTASSTCSAGVCSAVKPLPCDDGNPCTADACVAKKGCAFTPTTAACDDKDGCTSSDACVAGACTGAKKSCDDGAFCTFDSCDPASGSAQPGCKNEANDKLCDDDNPCTTEKCNAAAKSCSFVNDDKATCSDGSECTTDTCTAGKCVSVNTCQCVAAGDCDDNNACTADLCTGGKCTYSNNDSGKCDTGDKCQQPGSGVCSGGKCNSGNKPLDCGAQASACATAACNPAIGKCEVAPKSDGTQCEDGQGCTVGDTCKAGKCAAGPPANCNTADKHCVTGTCTTTATGTGFTCATQPKTKGTACEDGKACTEGDNCDGVGSCLTGKPKLCPGGGPCVDTACDEATSGCVAKPKPKGIVCDDGQFCTQSEVCNGTGGCTGVVTPCMASPCGQAFCDESGNKCSNVPVPGCCQTTADCSDGKPCTNDSCFQAKCQFAPVSGCCNAQLWFNSFDQVDSSGAGKLNGMTLVNSLGPALGWQVRSKSPPGRFKSAPGSLYYGDPAHTPNWFNFAPQNHSGTALTPVLALPKVTGTKVVFWLYMDVEAIPQYDQLTVFVQPAGGAKVVIWEKVQTMPQKAVHQIDVSLDKFAGMSLQVGIEFNTIDGAGNESEGLYVDDFQIIAPCTSGPPPG